LYWEEAGQLVPNKVKDLLDMGFKQIYELTTSSGSSVSTTATHPYLVKIQTSTSNPSSSTMKSLPLNDLTSDRSDDNANTSFLGLGG